MHRRLSYAEKGKAPAGSPPPPPRTARVRVPAFDSSELIRKHSLTLVGRLSNPKVQRIWSLIPFLSEHWNCETRPVGADLGQGCFQFQFASERDLLKVLDNQPYHFAHRMIMIQRWEPSMSPSFLNQIPFWIQVQGIPLHLWSEKTLRCIANDIGTFDQTEITSTVAKMRVFINGLQPLIRKTTIEFDEGPEVKATLVYEKLHGFCSTCHSLCHSKKDCPEKPQTAENPPPITTQRTGAYSPPEPARETPRSSPSSQRNPQRRRENREYDQPRYHSRGSLHSYDRSRENWERPSHSSRLRNPPSTERTITARNLHRSASSRDPRGRDGSFNSYHSREYRRHASRTERHHPYQVAPPPRAAWVEKHNQRALPLEMEESSRPIREHPMNQGNPQEVTPPPAQDILPHKALESAREEVREYMMQYSSCADPVESEARKERFRLAEEQGEIEETAAQMVRTSMESHRGEDILPLMPETTPERIPARQRLGPLRELQSTFDRLGVPERQDSDEGAPRSLDPSKKKRLGRPPGRSTSSLALSLGAGTRKRKMTKLAPSPRISTGRNVRTIPQNEENMSKATTSKGTGRKVPSRSKAPRGRPPAATLPNKKKGADFRIPSAPLP